MIFLTRFCNHVSDRHSHNRQSHSTSWKYLIQWLVTVYYYHCFRLKAANNDLTISTWMLTALPYSLRHFAILHTHSVCPPSQKHALVSARLKKSTIDTSDLNSLKPISNLSFTSKLVECSVATRFVLHCNQNHEPPVRQSAFRRHHSTETAVLIMHNIIRAIDIG